MKVVDFATKFQIIKNWVQCRSVDSVIRLEEL